MAENYRRKYKKHYGIDFSRKYDIHHIDLNHENDDIGNLVLLPKKLHSRYHFLLSSCRISENSTIISLDTAICSNSLNNNNYQLNEATELLKTVSECNKWYDYKLYLDGLIPNIHGIKLED